MGDYSDEDDDYNAIIEPNYSYSFDNMDEFLNDPEEFTSFISSGYGTRSNSTIQGANSGSILQLHGQASDVIGDATEVINSLHLDIPELEPILSVHSPRKLGRNKPQNVKRAKMTELGFKMSKMIMSSARKVVDENEEADGSLELELEESGDSLVDNYGQAKRRQKTGKRGRPKGTVKVGTQFGRASSTHALPPNVSALMGQANVAYVQKQYQKAIELYLQVVQRAPSSPEPYYSLGLVHDEQGNSDKAASYFLIAAHLQPRADGELWRRIASLLVQVPRKEQAVYCLTRAIKAPKLTDYQVEDDFPLFWLRAKLQLELGQYKSVITGFSAALRGHFSQDPEDLSIFILVARLAVRMSLAYVAGGVFTNVFRSVVSAALPLTWSHLNILIELAEVDEDYVAMMESIEEFAVPCYLHSGKEQGRTDWMLKSPREQFEKAVSSADIPSELKLKMAIAQVHLGRTNENEIVTLLAQIDRPGVKLKLSAADALSLSNAPMSAVQILLECIEMDGSQATSELCLKIGQNYRKAGELEMATETFLAVLQVDPEHRATRMALSEAYRSLGKIEQALQVLPREGFEPSSASAFKEEGFIDRNGLDELFLKVIGVGLDFDAEEAASVSSDGEEDAEIYSEETTVKQSKQVRFGPERIKRAAKYKKYHPQISESQIVSLRTNYDNLMLSNDKQSGGLLLQFFSDNLEMFRSNSFPGSFGLDEGEWSEALLKVLILQAGDFVTLKVDRGEWDRLGRILKTILALNLKGGDSIKWRVFGLIFSARAEGFDVSLFMNNLKALLNKTTSSGAALIPSEFLHHSSSGNEFLVAFYHPVTFRFLTRLNKRTLQSNPALLVLLGHQSLETQNYDEATRLYLMANELVPRWPFIKLCLGNCLMGRAFQRTCQNQLAKLMQALGYFLQYVRESEELELEIDGEICAQAWFNAGRAFHQAGFLSPAVQYYRKCIDSNFHGFMDLAKYNLSRLYLQCGSTGMARLTLMKNR